MTEHSNLPESSQAQASDHSLQNQPAEPLQKSVSRRHILGAGVAMAAALALPKSAQAARGIGLGEAETYNGMPMINPELFDNSLAIMDINPNVGNNSPGGFPQPEEWRPIGSGNVLTAVPVSVVDSSAAQGARAYGVFRAYKIGSGDPTIPGPTFKFQDGDRIELTLKNRMNDDPDNQDMPGSAGDTNDPFCGANSVTSGLKTISDNRPSCFNTTNLHFHGFHVSPKIQDIEPNDQKGPASDAVLIETHPGEDQAYVVQLPVGHAPGTHWYHPHRHGSTGAQVSNALAGAMIIEEQSNQVVYPGAYETVWSIQELVTQNPSQPDLTVYTTKGNAASAGSLFLVNGKKQPTMNMKANTVHRFRFVNATSTPRGFGKLVIEQTKDADGGSVSNVKQNMYLVAMDGITFYGEQPEQTTGVKIAPGNRADVILKLPAGTYEVHSKPTVGASGTGRPSSLLATIVVQDGEGIGNTVVDDSAFTTWTTTSIPLTGRPAYLNPIANPGQITPTQTVVFSPKSNTRPTGPYTGKPSNVSGKALGGTFAMGPTGGKTELYGNNGALTEPLGSTVKAWTIQSKKGPHPFHIHVNPFLVDISGNGDWSKTRWFDTYTVDANSNASINILHRFEDYPGTFVAHCHILIHEDMGMMQDVVVTDNGGSGIGPGEKLTIPTVGPKSV